MVVKNSPVFSKIQFEYLFKNYVILWGEEGRSSKDYIVLQGGGGGRSMESKKGLRNF